jgi:hypothetical protein
MSGSSERELDIAHDEVCMQLRAHLRGNEYSKDYWPLATFSGGIEEMSFSREGDTTIVRIRSPKAKIWCDEVHRPPTVVSAATAANREPG